MNVREDKEIPTDNCRYPGRLPTIICIKPLKNFPQRSLHPLVGEFLHLFHLQSSPRSHPEIGSITSNTLGSELLTLVGAHSNRASACAYVKGLTSCAQKVHPVLLPRRDPRVFIWLQSLPIKGAVDARTQCSKNALKAQVHTIPLDDTLLRFSAYTRTPFTHGNQSETLSTTRRPSTAEHISEGHQQGILAAFLRSAGRREFCTERFILLTWYGLSTV